jgi:flagellin-specific chaperone FliS
MDMTFDVDSFFASSQEIKRDMSEEEEHHVVASKRKGTKRQLDPEEADKRNLRRRENQKVACRNYRMRKKEHLSELKARIQELEAEKERLTKENMNHKAKSTSAVDPLVASILNEMARILQELENSLKNNADERSVEYLLQAFIITANKLHNANMKEVDELVNPSTQATLVNMGYMPSMEFPEVSPINLGGWWEPFISAANLTPDQCIKMQDIISKLCKRDLELRMERGVIDKQIKQFYLSKLMIFPVVSTSSPIDQLDTKTILDFTWLLNRLKSNIITQKSLLLTSQSQISTVLRPKQHALLVINVCQSRVFEWPYHAQTLRAAWDLVSREAASPASPLVPVPLSPPSPMPSSPESYYSPQYLSPSPSPTLIPSIAIPTPVSAYPQPSFSVAGAPLSPSLTSSCTSQLPGTQHAALNSSFLSSLNYGVH